MSAAVLALVLQAGVAPVPGDLLVTNFGGDTVTWFHHTTGEYGGVFVAEGSGGLERPVGLVFAPEGDLLVASAGTHQILRYDGATGAYEGVFAEHERLRVLVGDLEKSRLYSIPATGASAVPLSTRGLAGPEGIAFGPPPGAPPTRRIP